MPATFTLLFAFVLTFVATAPTACGIETILVQNLHRQNPRVATAPTACGIETLATRVLVLTMLVPMLQQHLPLAVLKPSKMAFAIRRSLFICCNSTYRLRY